MRGQIKPLTRAEAVARARLMAGPAGAAIRYRLADHQGGTNPFAEDCASHWLSTIMRIDLATADCAGFVAWCLGYDRFQPKEFPLYGGWINCDSILGEARTSSRWFEIVPEALPGDLVVFPSIDFDHDGDRDRVGHVGIVTDVTDAKVGDFADLVVAHCSATNDKTKKRAIAITTGAPWEGRDQYRGKRNPRWGSAVVRYKRFTDG